VKSAEEIMNILEAYDLTGSLRDAAELVGCSHHTVARYVAAREQGRAVPGSPARRPGVIDEFLPKLEELVERSKGKIRADKAHEHIAVMGYAGSERTTRRAVAGLKAAWRGARRPSLARGRRRDHRGRRPRADRRRAVLRRQPRDRLPRLRRTRGERPVTAAAPAPPPIDAGLEQLLRRMRLPHMRRIAPEVLATAKAQRWDPAEVLRALLAEEVAGRDRSALATRRARAAFPTGKTFAAWDEQLSSIPAPTQAALRTLEWVSRHENLVVCGPSGTGKTFLLEALGQAAVQAGKHVAWFTLEQLGVLIRRHRADDSVAKAIARILRADLVVVDDIGLLPVAPTPPKGSTA
jgi:hypothetical protein